jgi:regulatory protein
VRDKNLPAPERRKTRSRTARGGASARKRGAAQLTVVEDPGTWEPSNSGLGDSGSGGEEPGEKGPYDGSLWSEGPVDQGAIGAASRSQASHAGDSRDGEPGDREPGGPEPGGEEAARVICLRLLTSGPRTRAQLATALRKRRIPDEVADSVLGRFAEVGLIDDAAFARAWVESRHHGRGLARKALAAELRQRGVADGEVRSAVGLLGPQDELAAAQQLVARRVAAGRGRPMPVRARQLMGMLARKGYPAGLAAQVVREALEQDQADSGSSADLAWISEDGASDDWS